MQQHGWNLENIILSGKIRPWATGAVKYHFYQNRSKQNEALCCWGIGTYVIYFLKSKGMINTNFKIAVTGTEGIKELGHGIERNNSVEHY